MAFADDFGWSWNGTTKTITISGSGAMPDYAYNTMPWKDHKSDAEAIVINHSVTSIGQHAFDGFTKVTSIKFGTGTGSSSKSAVTSIGTYAFYSTGITKIYYYGGIDAWMNIDFATVNANPLYSKGGALYIDGTAAGNILTSLTKAVNIKNYVFAYNKSLETITLEEGVTSVGAQAFQGCTALLTVNLPQSLETLGSSAFNNSTNISTVRYAGSIEDWYTNITFTNSFSNPICYAHGLYLGNNDTPVSSITINGTNISASAFYNNWALESVTFSETAKTIGSAAFNGCTGLTSVTLPSTLESVGANAFQNCTGLETATIGVSIGERAFQACSNLQTVIYLSTGSPISIGGYAFYNCTKLQYLTLSADVTTIASSAFNGDSKLADGYVNYLGTIDDWCSINFGSSQSNPVYYAKALKINGTTVTNATIGVESIGQFAFYQNEALSSVTFQSTVKSIGQQAFYKCTGISGSLAIPDGITSIGQQAFNGCTGITGTLTIPSGITALLDNTFKDCSGITSLDISNVTNLQTIGSNTFQNCAGLTGILTIPSIVTSIGSNAFYGCSSLAGLDMSKANSLLTIGSSAFRNCTNISGEIFIPASVTSIGNQAFQSCTSVTKIVSPKNTFPTASSNTFSTMTGLGSSSVHVGSSSYSTATGWSALASKMVTLVSGQCGENVYYTLSNDHHTLYIYGTGDMYNTWGSSSYPWYSYKSDIQHVEISSGVTSIGKYAFYGCSNLESITIPISVATFNTSAFSSCGSLATVNYLGTANQWASCTFTSSTGNPIYASKSLQLNGEALTTCSLSVPVQAYAFYDDDALQTLVLDEGCTFVGEYAFKNCSNLNSVTISSDVVEFKSEAFNLCSALNKSEGGIVNYLGTTNQWASIDFAGSSANPAYYNYGLQFNGNRPTVYEISVPIKQYAFYRNRDVINLTLGNDVTSIGSYAFDDATALATVTCSASTQLDSIASSAFYGCTALSSLTLPSSLRKVMGSAFYNCNALNSENGVNFLGTVNQWASVDFPGYSANPAYYAQKLKINGSLLEECTLSVDVKPYTFYENKSLTSVSFASGCASIGSNAFYKCTALACTISIPSSVTSIGGSAFYGCSLLTGLDLTKANILSSIGSSAFYNCTNISGELYLPASMEIISGNTFQNNEKITAIYASRPTFPTGISAYTFNKLDKENTPLYLVSTTAKSNYEGNEYWNQFSRKLIGGYCGVSPNEASVKWEFNTTSGLLTISGSGAMKDYANSNSNRAPWYSFASSVNSIKICDGVTHVGKYAFNNCSNATEVWMSTTVTECGNSAFWGCDGLTLVKYGKTSTPTLSYATNWAQIDFGNYSANPLSFAHSLQVYKPTNTMPAWETVIGFENRSITSIKKFAFYGCTSLTSATLPSDVETIEESAFYGCTNLAAVTLPDALTTIGKEAFKNCSKLPSITIPENVTVMTCHSGNTTYSIFGGCTHLTTIVWNARNCANDYIKVGTGSGYNYGTPFSGIYSQITSITFGENVERIPNFLCYHMDHLTSVTIPASVTNIGTEAFDACSSTMSVTCEGTTPPTLASGAFSSPSTKKLYLPHDIDVKAAYRAASGWSSFTEENTYPKIVQFSLNGKEGDAVDPQYFDNLTSKASVPSDPIAAPFHFNGWYENTEGTGSAFAFASTNITADKTLFAKWTLLVLNEGVDNSDALEAYDGLTTNVTMTRSLTNAQYNTFCLPFSLDASQMTTAFGAGYDLEELTDVTYDGEVLGLVFTQREALEAGKPYLLQPANNVSNPSFTGVEIDASTPSDGLDNTFIEFHGVYSPTELTGGNKNLLFLGAGNELFWPSSTGDLKGFRAYFEVKGSAQKAVRARIVKKEDTATGIDQITNDQLPITNKFLRNGQLLILRDGKTYNAQGMLVE